MVIYDFVWVCVWLPGVELSGSWRSIEKEFSAGLAIACNLPYK